MANPRSLESPFKLPPPGGGGGSGCPSCAGCTQLHRDTALPLEKKRPPLVPHLANDYFLGDTDLQFMNDFPGAKGTGKSSSVFGAQRWSGFQFWTANEDYGMDVVNLELSEWAFIKGTFCKSFELMETHLRV